MMHLRSLFCVGLLGLAFVPSSFAADPGPAKLPRVTELFLSLKADGENRRFHIVKSFDEDDRLTLDVSLVEVRNLLPDTERAILYGRDLNDDGHADTWFVRDGHQITAIYADDARVDDFDGNSDAFGTASIQRIATHQLKLGNRWFAEIAFRSTASFISLAIADAENAAEAHAITALNLLELQQRALLHASDEEAQAIAAALFDRGWELNEDRLARLTRGRDYVKSGAIDIGLTVTGIKLFKWIGRSGEWVLVKAANTPVIQKVAARLPRLPMPTWGEGASKVVASAAPLSFRALTFEMMKLEVEFMIRRMTARNLLARQIVKTLALQTAKFGKFGSVQALEVYRAGLAEWKYFLATQLMQVLGEAITRYDVIYDPNPIVMAENLFTDPDFIQNFLYMSNETLLLSGISSRDPNVKRRMLICGVVSAVNSTAMNVAIKGNADKTRIGADAGWEVIIGNTQVQLDLAAIDYFKRLAVKQNNPKLKVLGYVVTLVDQLVGYTGYAKAMSAVDRYQVRLVPIVNDVP